MAVLSAASFIAAVLEAFVLVVVVTAGLALAQDSGAVELHLPLIGTTSASPASMLALATASAIMSLAAHVGLAKITASISVTLTQRARSRAIAAYSAASWERQANDREGSLQETTTVLAVQGGQVAILLAILLTSFIGLAALLISAFIVNPLVTLIVIVFALLLFMVLRPVTRLTRHRAQASVRANAVFAEHIGSWTTLAMDLRVFGVEQVQADRLEAANGDAAEKALRMRFVSRIGGSLYKDLALVFLVGAVGSLYWASDVDLAAVGAVVLLVIRSISYAQGVQSSLHGLGELSPALELLVVRLRSLEAEAEPVGVERLTSLDEIQLCRVGYDYEPGRPGIDDVSLTLAPGEAVGVVGPSGAGKSTLVQVLLRLRPPTRGSVVVGGLPYQDVAPESWHQLVALVPQEPKLFQGTIADNITFLRPNLTRSDIEAAAIAAHVYDDIMRLPGAFDTELGPRGIGLSGGQKQRVAIARALVGHPQLLVLDEPTSALDGRSEELLQETIAQLHGRVTLVIIAHRLSTLTVCDRILGMQDGRVTVVGTLDEALAHISLTDGTAVRGGGI